MSAPPPAESESLSSGAPSQWVVLPAMGAVQILMWGSTVYLPAVLAPAMVPETGWPLTAVIAGASLGLLVAGLLSPVIGRCVARFGGRPVLTFGSFAVAAGFVALASASSLPAYWAAWLVLGVGMGSGLYDAAFAALGRIYGEQARTAITNLTLFGGFGSTVCWPLSAWMMGHWGWRSACLAYAAIHLLVAMPLLWFVLPAQRTKTLNELTAAETKQPAVQLAPSERRSFWLLAAVQTLAQAIGSIVIVHLMVLLQARGLTLAAAVTLGTLLGPAQVAARVVERVFGHRYHPVWTMLSATLLMAVGLALLLVHVPIVAVAVLVYGAGYGVTWIARGTLPLRLFGPARYPVLIGRLALPSLIAQALSPFAGALLIEHAGTGTTIAFLVGMACLNVAIVTVLWRSCRGSTLIS